MNIRWLPYPNTHLEFSNTGQCRNITNKRVLKPSIRRKYLCITTKIKQKTLNIPVHRAVAILFLNKVNYLEMQVNHINGNKLDNGHENLEWVTLKENIHHAVINGLRRYQCGEMSGMSKADDISSLTIRSFSFSDKKYFLLKNYVSSPAAIYNHIGGKVFKHLPIITKEEVINERSKYGNDFIKR